MHACEDPSCSPQPPFVALCPQGLQAQPVLAAIVSFVLLQQVVLMLSSRGLPPCPTLPLTREGSIASDENIGELHSAFPKHITASLELTSHRLA